MIGFPEQINIRGVVNIVGKESKILNSKKGYFIEIIGTKVFEEAMKITNNIDLLLNHDRNRKLGSTKDGSLKLWEDNVGLIAKCNITDKEVIEKYKNNKLVGWSFGFVPLKDRWVKVKDDVQRRYIEELYLTEVSILDNRTSPAYHGTTIDTEKIERRSLMIFHNNYPYSVYEKELEILRLKGGKYNGI